MSNEEILRIMKTIEIVILSLSSPDTAKAAYMLGQLHVLLELQMKKGEAPNE